MEPTTAIIVGSIGWAKVQGGFWPCVSATAGDNNTPIAPEHGRWPASFRLSVVAGATSATRPPAAVGWKRCGLWACHRGFNQWVWPPAGGAGALGPMVIRYGSRQQDFRTRWSRMPPVSGPLPSYLSRLMPGTNPPAPLLAQGRGHFAPHPLQGCDNARLCFAVLTVTFPFFALVLRGYVATQGVLLLTAIGGSIALCCFAPPCMLTALRRLPSIRPGRGLDLFALRSAGDGWCRRHRAPQAGTMRPRAFVTAFPNWGVLRAAGGAAVWAARARIMTMAPWWSPPRCALPCRACLGNGKRRAGTALAPAMLINPLPLGDWFGGPGPAMRSSNGPGL